MVDIASHCRFLHSFLPGWFPDVLSGLVPRAALFERELTDSAGWGIFLTEKGILTAENNTFETNAEGEIRRPEE